MRQGQSIRTILRRLLLSLTIAYAAIIGIVSFVPLSLAAEDSALKDLRGDWRAKAPWCRYLPAEGLGSGNSVAGDISVKSVNEFASKNEDGIGSDTPSCNDGDSIMFNGLLCGAGVEAERGEKKVADGERHVREVGCDVVKHSQTLSAGSSDYGRWWRSPRRTYLASLNQQSEGGSETTFSNDHALGVMVYIAQTKDVAAFRAWTDWIKNKGGVCSSFHCIPGLPRYCPDDRCGFKIIDCPLLDRLAKYLGQANPLCASDSVKEVQGATWAVTDRLWSVIDGLLAFLTADRVKLNDIVNKYGAGKEGAHSLERVTIINSITNNPGYPLHDVAVTIYLLRKFGIANEAESQFAAEIAYARATDNAFFDFVANGPTAGAKSKILFTDDRSKVCPTKTNDTPHPAFQWIWERKDIKETAQKTMYWDCVFVASAFMKGDYPAPTVLPGIKEVATEIAKVRDLLRLQ